MAQAATGSWAGGAVFLAHDELLSSDVALKRLHGAQATAETAKRLAPRAHRRA